MSHHEADRSAVDRAVAALTRDQVEPPVRSALGDAGARVTSWSASPVAYDFLNPSSGGVYRVSGGAGTADGELPWRLVLKVTRAVERLAYDPPLPDGFLDELAEAVRWDRELHAFESGFLSGLDGLLAAPACHGAVRNDDGTAWLWLEDLTGAEGGRWAVDRYAELGHALGEFNGRFLASGRVPDDPWLGRRWLRTWVERITPLSFGRFLDPAAWADPRVAAAFPPVLRERLLALWDERAALLGAVERLPRTCAHLDAHRRNLFVRGGRLVAIDWGLLGLAAPGEEIAASLVGTLASGELGVEDAEALAGTLYAGYLTGLRAAGWQGDDRDVRLGFAAAAGLRVFSVLGLDAGDGARLQRSAALAPVLLDLADEALALAARP